MRLLIIALLCSSFGLYASAPISFAAETVGPKYSRIVRTLPSQAIHNATLVYWDQSAADAMGITTPPGRVGVPEFDQAILQKMAFEVKAGARGVNPQSTLDDQSHPYIFVEHDSFGGSGRAGYIEVQPGVWVNIKGIGITGAGRTQPALTGPPSETFTSHADGSATFEEAIKETVSGRIADAELSRGAGRVLAIIYTGRTIRYPDGREVPLALIVRTPLRRYDQDVNAVASKVAVTEALAEANAKRIFKGDFVNESNMGSLGEFIDYGTMSFTQGYGPLKSSQRALFLQEGTRFSLDNTLYLRALGEGLMEQMGIPEEHLLKLAEQSSWDVAKFEIGARFTESVYYNDGNISTTPTVLDFTPVSVQQLEGNVRFQEFFKNAAKNYFTATGSQEEIFNQELQRLISLSTNMNDGLIKKLSSFLKEVHNSFEKVAVLNGITDRAAYGEKLQTIARFKNRTIADLVRPQLFQNSGSLADQFVRDHQAQPVQSFIENTVLGNRFGTTGVSDSQILVTADSHNTKISIRAFEDAGHQKKLFQYPELGGASGEETFFFRVTTDGWQSSRDLPAKFVHTKVGSYLQIEIPHGSMPITEAQVELAPFVKESSGNIRWVGDHLNLRGPPIVLNERLGLPASFTPKAGVMKTKYDVSISVTAPDLTPIEPNQCEVWMSGT